jgi:uncharacterized protein (TIGR03437 family)
MGATRTQAKEQIKSSRIALMRLRLAWSILWLVVIPATAQTPLWIQTLPIGNQPLGVAVVNTGNTTNTPYAYAAVALSGDNAVAFLQFQQFSGSEVVTPLSARVTVPSPYAIAACGSQFVVTSPSAGTVTVIQTPNMTVQGTLNVGPQPYSVACFTNTGTTFTAAVSTLGDNSLVLLDLTSLTVTARVAGVAGSRGYHGIFYTNCCEPAYLWVAGTDQSVVTVVDPIALKVVITFPVSTPTSIALGSAGMEIASAGSNSIVVYSTALGLVNAVTGVPSPQDLFISAPVKADDIVYDLGDFVACGSGNPLLQLSHSSPPATANIQAATGAAAVAGTSFFDNFAGPSQYAFVLATIPSANSVVFMQQQPNAPSALSIVNAASFQIGSMANGAIVPGSLATLFASDGAAQDNYASAIPLPSSLAGISLQIGSLTFSNATGLWSFSATTAVDAPLLFVGPNQINFQVPPNLTSGSPIGVQLTSANGSTLVGLNSVVAALPGIFTLFSGGSGQGSVLNQNNTQNFATNPASRGSVIQIFATGAGTTNPVLAAGAAAPASGALVLTVLQPTVTIGGVNAPVQFSGLAPGFVGVWQINAVVPQSVTPGSAVSLVVSAGGVASNTVTIAVQ